MCIPAIFKRVLIFFAAMAYIITGGCGFLGSNLAKHLLLKGHQVTLFDNLSRKGSRENLASLRSSHSLDFIEGDITNSQQVDALVRKLKPEAICHLTGQVAMTTSIKYPLHDFRVNALGTFNLLESVRRFSPSSDIAYSYTNKVYGDLSTVVFEEQETRYVAPDYPDGFDERTLFDPMTPYGISKATADMYLRDYARLYGLKTIVFRHSSLFGGYQHATYDQGWIGWFCEMALKTAKNPSTTFDISGSGRQVRDVLHADDAVRLYEMALSKADAISGNAFNIGGGMDNSLSLLELFAFLERELNVTLAYEHLPFRVSDQKVFVADTKKATRMIGWKPAVDKATGIRKVLASLGKGDE